MALLQHHAASPLRWSPVVLALLAAVAGSCCKAAEPAKLLVKNAWIATMDAATPDPFHGYLVVGRDGRLTAVAPGEPPAELAADEVLDARGKIVIPGFLSGHSHLWQSAFRGVAPTQLVMPWVMMLHRTYGPFFGKGDLYAFTLHGALDYLSHGITTAFNYSQPLNLPNELYEEEFAAEATAGERFVFGYAPPNQPPFVAARKNFDAFYKRVGEAPPPTLLKISLVTEGSRIDEQGRDPYLEFFLGLMRDYNLTAQLHYLESPDSALQQKSFPLLAASGLLGPRISFAHFIHTTDEILAKSGAAHAGMSWNPLSNGRLGSGFADIPKYLKAGIRVGMGLDGQASADIADPFENMRMGLYAMRDLYQDAGILKPIDVLRFHTIGTAEVLGVGEQVGSLTVGKFGDFLLIDLGLMDTGPVFDLYATLVFAAGTPNIERIYVGGELSVDHGRPTRQDMPAVSADVAARVGRIRARFDASKRPSTPP